MKSRYTLTDINLLKAQWENMWSWDTAQSNFNALKRLLNVAYLYLNGFLFTVVGSCNCEKNKAFIDVNYNHIITGNIDFFRFNWYH